MVKSVLGLPRSADPAAVAALVAELELPEAIAAILVRRGYGDPAAAKAFLRPRLEGLHDPWTLPDMEAAVDDALVRLRTTLTIRNVHAYLADLPQDVAVVAAEPIVPRASRAHRYQTLTVE